MDWTVVACMEEILDLYAEADERYFSVVCFNECPIQLVSEVHQSIATKPSQRYRRDYHYRREGTANLSSAFDRVKAGGISYHRH